MKYLCLWSITIVTAITSPSCWGTHFLYISNPPSGNLPPIIPWVVCVLAAKIWLAPATSTITPPASRPHFCCLDTQTTTIILSCISPNSSRRDIKSYSIVCKVYPLFFANCRTHKLLETLAILDSTIWDCQDVGLDTARRVVSLTLVSAGSSSTPRYIVRL